MPRSPFAVVLVRPLEEGNIGAAARAMANMGLDELVLVEPAPKFGDIARRFAVGAESILDGARRVPSLVEALAPYRRVLATTSLRGRSQGVDVVEPAEMLDRLAADEGTPSTAIVFGPEVSGLTREELAHAAFAVRIPCAPEQPTLNLAQSVLLLAWELRRSGQLDGTSAPIAASESRPATAAEIDGLFDQALPTLERIGFVRDDSWAGVVRDLRHLVARSAPNEREVRILRGILRRASRALGSR